MKTKHHFKNKVDQRFERGIIKTFAMKFENISRPVLLASVILNSVLISALVPYHIEVKPNILLSQSRIEAEPTLVPVETFDASVSGYTSREQETDSTPFITANGDHVYYGGVACPSRYKFGTKVLINEKVFTCNDRMNKRYRDGNYFDIWMPSLEQALEHGRRQVEISILK